MFGSYLIYGLIYAAAAEWRQEELPYWLACTVSRSRFKVGVQCADLAFCALVMRTQLNQ
jgi:hypothetical protein